MYAPSPYPWEKDRNGGRCKKVKFVRWCLFLLLQNLNISIKAQLSDITDLYDTPQIGNAHGLPAG